MRFSSLVMPLALLAASACQPPAERGVEDAWVRLPAASGRPGAAYFTLAGGEGGATLTGVESPPPSRAELHEMADAGGVLRMSAVATIPVPAGGEVKLAPGGLHVMLFDLPRALQPGGTLPLTLVFADGKRLTTEAKLIGPGDPAP